MAYRIFRVLNWETALSARGPTSTRPPRGSADDGRLDPGSRPGLILGCWAMLGASHDLKTKRRLRRLIVASALLSYGEPAADKSAVGAPSTEFPSARDPGTTANCISAGCLRSQVTPSVSSNAVFVHNPGSAPSGDSILSSPLSSRARRSLPLRSRSAPLAQRRSATCALRLGSLCR